MGDKKGKLNGRVKLTEADIREIRDGRRSGKTFARLGSIFGVSAEHISRICKCVAWKHLETVNLALEKCNA